MSKSKVTEISESDNSKHCDDWNPSSNTSTQQPNLSQVNTIGCADKGLWIFSLEDSKKRRYSVNWDETNQTEKWKTEEHELMIDSGCFWHICPPWFEPQFPMVSSTNVDAVTANNVALQHYGQKWCTGTWWRTVENESWSRSHLTWWTYALKHRGVTIIFNHDYDRIIFETRQWIWYLTIVIPIFARHLDEWNSSLQSVGDGWRECDKWRGRRSLRQCWKPEKWGSRSFSWWSTSNRRSGSSRTAWYFWWGENCKSTTYSWTADRCCENGTQHDKRSIRRLVSDLCCESWTKFSAQTSGGEQDSGYVTEIPSRLHVHSNSGGEQNSAMYHILGNAQWSGDQLHVRSERWLWGLDQRNPATLWSLGFHQSSDHSMRQRDEYHWPVQKSCTRTKRENSVTICAKNQSSEHRVCRSNTGTRTMLPDTNWDEHGRTTFSNFTCHTICNSLRWICSLNFHSATRRQNSISIFA